MLRRTMALAAAGILAGASLQAQSLPRTTPEDVGLSSERLERIGAVFQEHVDEGRIAGAVGMILRRGSVVYEEAWGMRDVAAADAMEADDIFRIYSMSKPITSVAVMMLFEEGRFFLTDPIGRFLPELAGLPVAVLGDDDGVEPTTERARRQVTIQDLLRHTSGLSYGIFSNTSVDKMYRDKNILGQPNLEAMITELAEIPLLYQPGTQWNYSVSTDVLGRLVEVVSGQPFDAFLRERILEPLGMTDTGFYVPGEDLDRLTRTYAHAGRDHILTLGDTVTFTKPTGLLSGGGGLLSTAQDYARFTQMLLNGGELDGVRLLSPRTIELMRQDHLGDAAFVGRDTGRGFGLGFQVKTVAGLDGTASAVGEYSWGGLHGTKFWIDPAEELVGIFLIQIYPNRDIQFREQFKTLVYQALIR